jgi:outer membrane protein TolC
MIAATGPVYGRADAQVSLPSPLALQEVVRLAGERRQEVEAARARTRAGEARPVLAAALPDPMVSPSIDHLPFDFEGVNLSVTIEQQFPLSAIRGHRRAAALAGLDRLRAESSRTTLDVGFEAATAFLMLYEQRRTQALVGEQLTFARDLVTATNVRYAAGTAPQSDVLRAEVEVARLEAQAAALSGSVYGAELMLATALALDLPAAIPPLAAPRLDSPVPAWPALRSRVDARPEIAAQRAEVARAAAEVDVMRDMFRPMAAVRTGPAYTMAEGRGWMAMVGLSLPVWRSKLRAGVAEADAMRAMADAELRAMTRMLEGEAAVAAAAVQAAADRQRALVTNVLPRARLALDPAVAGYTAGQLPLVSVIEAIQALWLVQADAIAADLELGVAQARLGRAVGTFDEVLR